MSDEFGTPAGETPAGAKDDKRRRRLVLWISLGLVAVVVIALVIFWAVRSAGGTDPEPTPTATVTETPTPTATPTETPTPTATAEPDAITLPTECSEAFSPAFFDQITGYGLPLNDPTVADSPITKSESVERLREALPHLRCTWGAASDSGILSAINIVDEAQRNAAIAALTDDGYTCADELGGTNCIIEFLDDTGEFAAAGESHYLRGNGWVSSYWTQIDFTGYNEDIIATLWG